MDAYDFKTNDFALSNQGIHLLRSGFNYKTIEYEQIEKATIRWTTEIKNVFLSMLFSILLLAFAISQSFYLIKAFNDPNVHRIYIESIVLPVLPGLVGAYLLYVANKKGLVLIVEAWQRQQKLRMNDFLKNGKAGEVSAYLKARIPDRLVVYENDSNSN